MKAADLHEHLLVSAQLEVFAFSVLHAETHAEASGLHLSRFRGGHLVLPEISAVFGWDEGNFFHAETEWRLREVALSLVLRRIDFTLLAPLSSCLPAELPSDCRESPSESEGRTALRSRGNHFGSVDSGCSGQSSVIHSDCECLLVSA